MYMFIESAPGIVSAITLPNKINANKRAMSLDTRVNLIYYKHMKNYKTAYIIICAL